MFGLNQRCICYHDEMRKQLLLCNEGPKWVHYFVEIKTSLAEAKGCKLQNYRSRFEPYHVATLVLTGKVSASCYAKLSFIADIGNTYEANNHGVDMNRHENWVIGYIVQTYENRYKNMLYNDVYLQMWYISFLVIVSTTVLNIANQQSYDMIFFCNLISHFSTKQWCKAVYLTWVIAVCTYFTFPPPPPPLIPVLYGQNLSCFVGSGWNSHAPPIFACFTELWNFPW